MRTIIIIILLILVGGGIAAAILLLGGNGEINPSPSVSPGQSLTPTPSASISPSASPEANIIVTSPASGSIVNFPFSVQGRGRVFENVLRVQLKDSDGEIIFDESATAQSPDVGQFGNFTKEINYLLETPVGQNVVLSVFSNSPRDGSVINLVTVPLRINLGQTRILKAFFNNSQVGGEFDCNRVISVDRIVPQTQTPARKSLELLIKGPSAAERSEGFFSNINPEATINSVTITNGVARADFSEELETTGGSCRVAGIRSEIIETLKQFSTVQSVIISIEGRTEDILQP